MFVFLLLKAAGTKKGRMTAVTAILP